MEKKKTADNGVIYSLCLQSETDPERVFRIRFSLSDDDEIAAWDGLPFRHFDVVQDKAVFREGRHADHVDGEVLLRHIIG
ncbi:hypothetical protein SAMN04488126_1131 [Bhargavaea beijingensis]|uniref:Uncharacterized protein n=1 Tax=Bhargavaea beijingensis TaxID=426756 RepID=A0A1G7EBM2_9BACL|nr:hypothetical protein SAMN04488126_1131 [Bhargavaea beijingensis]